MVHQESRLLVNLPRIYAHRGASGYYVDNTMSSFKAAIKMGADAIESDIYVSKDGVPFMFHDGSCKVRGREREIWPARLYWDEVEKILLPNNEKVPSFREFLDEFSGKKNNYGELIKISLDIQNKGAETAVVRLAQAYDVEDQIEICTNKKYVFVRVRKMSSKIHLIASNSIRYRTFNSLKKTNSKYYRYNIETFNIKAEDFKTEYSQLLKKFGFKIYIWDLHSEEKIKKYLQYNPNGIYTNYPDIAVKIRDDLSKKSQKI